MVTRHSADVVTFGVVVRRRREDVSKYAGGTS